MTEKQFQKKVIKFLKSLPNTWFFKVWGGGFQRAGIPDLICCINVVFIAIELKGDNGKPTELQKMNIRNINAAGGIGIILYSKGFKEFKNIVKGVIICDNSKISEIKDLVESPYCVILKQ